MEIVLSPASLPRNNEDIQDIENSFLPLNSTSLFKVEKTNGSKEKSPRNSDPSIFKISSSMHGNNTVSTRKTLQYSSSKLVLIIERLLAFLV